MQYHVLMDITPVTKEQYADTIKRCRDFKNMLEANVEWILARDTAFGDEKGYKQAKSNLTKFGFLEKDGNVLMFLGLMCLLECMAEAGLQPRPGDYVEGYETKGYDIQ